MSTLGINPVRGQFPTEQAAQLAADKMLGKMKRGAWRTHVEKIKSVESWDHYEAMILLGGANGGMQVTLSREGYYISIRPDDPQNRIYTGCFDWNCGRPQRSDDDPEDVWRQVCDAVKTFKEYREKTDSVADLLAPLLAEKAPP